MFVHKLFSFSCSVLCHCSSNLDKKYFGFYLPRFKGSWTYFVLGGHFYYIMALPTKQQQQHLQDSLISTMVKVCLISSIWSSKIGKGQTKSKWLFQADVSSKNKQTNSTLLLWILRLTCFLEEIEDIKKDISKFTGL